MPRPAPDAAALRPAQSGNFFLQEFPVCRADVVCHGEKLMLWSDTIGSPSTHSAPFKATKTSEGAAAHAIAWIVNAVLVTFMASGFAISATGYSVAMWSAMYDLYIGRTERALIQKAGHVEPR